MSKTGSRWKTCGPGTPSAPGTAVNCGSSATSGACSTCSMRPGALPLPGPLRATFFVLGWIAERLPGLVREIAARGHEVASHGYSHRMCSPLPDEDLRGELVKSKHLLEDIVGKDVVGFRAPNFSIDDRVLRIVAESGYRYDSSYNNFDLHGRYGKVNLNGQSKSGIAYQLANGFTELPVSNLPVSSFSILGNFAYFKKFHLPWSGGAYFRLIPNPVFNFGVQSILRRTAAFVFYLHPWELDDGQPLVKKASHAARFKHYANIRKTENKLKKTLTHFTRCSFLSLYEYNCLHSN